MSTPKMSKVFESVFHGQVYELDGKEYDVPQLTYWAEDNVQIEDVPLDDLFVSKSDEKHGSKEFKKHAAKVNVKMFPIVVVRLNDGRLQIADGNHRAFKAKGAGQETIEAYVINQSDMPVEAQIDPNDYNQF